MSNDQSRRPLDARAGINTDTIAELTAASGVTVDGLLIKDGAISPAAGGAAFIDLTSIASGEGDIALKDNLADALTIRQGSNAYLTFVTTDSGEKVQAVKVVQADGGVNTDTIREKTSAAGVTVDGLLIKDGYPVSDNFVKAAITVGDATGGATGAALSLTLTRLDGSAVASARQVMIIGNAVQYSPFHTAEASVSYGTATAGSIIASGQGWCLAQTSAAGAFACTVTNTDDETLYFRTETAHGNSAAGVGALVVEGNVDSAAWSA